MIYIHKFDDPYDFEDAYYDESVTENSSWLSYLEDGYGLTKINYQKSYEDMPLTIEGLDDGNIEVIYDGETDDYTREIEYSINHGNWQSYEPSIDDSLYIDFSEGDIIQFRGYNSEYFSVDGSSYEYITRIYMSGAAKVYGNIMSLCNGSEFFSSTFVEPYAFKYLFSRNDGLVDAENLILPATELSEHCYSYMFFLCPNLIYAPKILPALDLEPRCYQYMFNGCEQLITAPKLPATNLANYCYQSMFSGCNDLEYAPELPATTLKPNCYSSMFYGCESLIDIPRLPATTLDEDCYLYMFAGCEKLTSVDVSVPEAVIRKRSMFGMFRDCTKLESCVIRPEFYDSSSNLDALTGMFQDCISLKYIKCLIDDYIYPSMCNSWMTNTPNNGTFVCTSGSDWSDVEDETDLGRWQIVVAQNYYE